MISKIAVLPTMLMSVSIAVAAERSAVIVDRDAFACTSWAAWHDYTRIIRQGRGKGMVC